MQITSSVDIAASPEEVFAWLSDFERNPQWQGGMKSARFTSEGPVAVGSTYEQVASFLGRRIETTFEVVAFEADRSITIASTSGTFPITVTRSVEPIEGGTRVHADVAGEPGGLFKLAGPLLARMVRKSVDGDYARLKELLEAG